MCILYEPIFIIVIAVLLTTASGQNETCLWASYEKSSWTEGAAICSGLGGQMVIYSNETDRDPVRNGEIPGISLVTSYWLGLRYDVGNSSWQWQDGTNVTYAPWKSGEPTDPSKCIIESIGEPPQWEKKTCNENHYVVCELPLGKCPCPEPQRPDLCYWYSYEKADFYSALSKCEQHGGTLLQVTDQETADWLAENVTTILGASSITDYTIGFNRICNASKWVYIGDETSYNDSFSYWDDGEPNDPVDACVLADTAKMSKWYDNDCYAEQYYICEISTVSAPTGGLADIYTCDCPLNNLLPDSGGCLWVSDVKKLYADAAQTCTDMGASVLKITQEVVDFLMLNTADGLADISEYWVGIHRDFTTLTIDWYHETDPTTPINYTNWKASEPNLSLDKLCARGKHSDSHQWASAKCTDSFAFLCVFPTDRVNRTIIIDTTTEEPSTSIATTTLQPTTTQLDTTVQQTTTVEHTTSEEPTTTQYQTTTVEHTTTEEPTTTQYQTTTQQLATTIQPSTTETTSQEQTTTHPLTTTYLPTTTIYTTTDVSTAIHSTFLQTISTPLLSTVTTSNIETVSSSNSDTTTVHDDITTTIYITTMDMTTKISTVHTSSEYTTNIRSSIKTQYLTTTSGIYNTTAVPLRTLRHDQLPNITFPTFTEKSTTSIPRIVLAVDFLQEAEIEEKIAYYNEEQWFDTRPTTLFIGTSALIFIIIEIILLLLMDLMSCRRSCKFFLKNTRYFRRRMTGYQNFKPAVNYRRKSSLY